MNKFHLILTVFISVFITSCDDESTSMQEPEEPTGDVLLVSQITIQVEGDTEVYTTNYNYDSENRLTSQDDSDGYILNYTYENGQLVSTLSTNGVDNSEDITEVYTYDSEGRVASVTIDIESFGSETINLTYNTDNSIIEGFSAADGELQERLTISNGNLVKFEEFDGTALITAETNTYDDMNAAFKSIALRETIIGIYSENLPSSLLYLGANNLLTQEYNVDGDLEQAVTFSYTYNDDGYPVSATEVYTEGANTETSTYTLTYISAQ